MTTRTRTTALSFVIPDTAASLLAGSIAGAVGVGVAFPLDTIKTRSQIMAAAAADTKNNSKNGNKNPNNNITMLSVCRTIYETDGLGGFFAGVMASMLGQAVIKATVFSANAAALTHAHNHHWCQDNASLQLVGAASAAGFVTAFLSVPVGRVKVMMQSGSSRSSAGGGKCSSETTAAAVIQGGSGEWHCLQAVLAAEGWRGLFGRGLLCTIVREVPAYSIYFFTYGALMAAAYQNPWLVSVLGVSSSSSSSSQAASSLAPLVFGAAAGCASFLPIYPIDVVKTLVQNTVGGAQVPHKSAWEVAVDLYETAGVGAFWDGLTPRMIRQAVNHAVTFYVYDLILHHIGTTTTAATTAMVGG
jgi:hypothetical protein